MPMLTLPFPRRVSWSLIPILLAGLGLMPLRVEAYDVSTAVPVCGYVDGLSTYAFAGVPDSGRVDFNRADWSVNPFNINQADLGRGALIAPSDQLCFDPDGEVYGTQRWAWNNNVGWIDFGWCDPGDLNGCEAYVPYVDFENYSPVNGAAWGGVAWNDNIGWIDFDWCGPQFPGCEAQEVRTLLPDPWPTSSTTEVGVVQGFAWNDNIGWIRFGGGTVAQQLPNSEEVMTDLRVVPVVSISPDPALATKYGSVVAPKANAEDPYEVHVDFRIVDEFGVPTGGYLDPTDYDVEMIVTTNAGSNFGSIKIDRSGVPAVFWDSMFGDPQSGGYSWYVNSFAPTSNLNGYENAAGVITKYFDMDSNYSPLPSRDYYIINDLDFDITPLSTAPTVEIDSGWNFNRIWDLKFAPLMEVTNLAYIPSNGPYSTTIPYSLDTNLSVRGLIMNWDDSPTVATIDSPYVNHPPSGFFSPSGPPLSGTFDGFLVGYRLISQTAPSVGSVFRYVSSTNGSPLNSGGNYSSVFFNEDDVSIPATLNSLVAGFSAAQNVPAGVATGARELNNLGGFYGPNSSIPSVETVKIDSATLGSATLNAARYLTEISYAIVDPLDSTRRVIVAYYSNNLASNSGTPIPILNFLDFDVDGDPNEYPTAQENPYPLLQPAKIIGSVTGSTAMQTVSPGGDVTLIGNVSTTRVRNALFQRLSKLKKGVTTAAISNGSVTLNNTLGLPSNSSNSTAGTSLMSGQVLYFTGGDVVINGASVYSQKTIVVEGGNIIITGDVPGTAALGLVALQNYEGNGGNIYIKNNVKTLKKVTMYADGSLKSTDNDTVTPSWTTLLARQQALTNQLYISGSLISKNTIGGATSTPKLLPTGASAFNTLVAAEADLNHLREFQVCWYAVQGDGVNPTDPLTPLNPNLVPWTTLPVLPADPTYFVSCGLEYGRATPDIPATSNEPLRIQYVPPPSSLPLFGS